MFFEGGGGGLGERKETGVGRGSFLEEELESWELFLLSWRRKKVRAQPWILGYQLTSDFFKFFMARSINPASRRIDKQHKPGHA